MRALAWLVAGAGLFSLVYFHDAMKWVGWVSWTVCVVLWLLLGVAAWVKPPLRGVGRKV
jgi:hypothetical protein